MKYEFKTGYGTDNYGVGMMGTDWGARIDYDPMRYDMDRRFSASSRLRSASSTRLQPGGDGLELTDAPDRPLPIHHHFASPTMGRCVGLLP
jgi:hypothetical protein